MTWFNIMNQTEKVEKEEDWVVKDGSEDVNENPPQNEPSEHMETDAPIWNENNMKGIECSTGHPRMKRDGIWEAMNQKGEHN